MRIKAILSGKGHKGGQALMAGAAALMFAGVAVPVATAQALVSSSLTSAEVGHVVDTLSEHVVSEMGATRIDAPGDQEWGNTPIQRSIQASPLAGLMALEQLEVLEVLENLDESSIFRPGNWAAIGAFMSGMSSTLSLTLQDENGNDVRIVAEPEGEGAAEIEFTDETGRRVLLDADADRDGSQIVTIGYVDEDEPYFSVVANDDGADLRFFDPEGRPTLMGVRDYGDDAIMRMEDVLTGTRGEFIFNNDDDSDEVFAPADGQIVAVGDDEGAGLYAVIDHGNGWSTIFFNMADIAVDEGQRVSQGDLLGLSTDEEFNWDGDADSIGIDIMRETNLSIVRTEMLEL